MVQNCKMRLEEKTRRLERGKIEEVIRTLSLDLGIAEWRAERAAVRYFVTSHYDSTTICGACKERHGSQSQQTW